MARAPDPNWEEFITGCKREKADCEEAIQSLRAGEARLFIGVPGSELIDVTADHILKLERIVSDMTRLIAECENETC